MPLIKSAKKKLRQDKKRTLKNSVLKIRFKTLVKKSLKSPSKKSVNEAFSAVDIAAKHSIIHKNKAARIKARLSKSLVTPKTAQKKVTSPSSKSA